MIPSTPSPSKKHYSTQHRNEQDAAERVWIRDVLERNSNPQAPDTSSTDVQLQLQLLLRNVGSRVRKSVAEGYNTPPTSLSTPYASPSKDHSTTNLEPTVSSPQHTSETQDRVFTSSKDILRSVYSQGRPLPQCPSPKKRGRSYDCGELGDKGNAGNDEEDRIDIDLPDVPTTRANSHRTIKPLPFRLSQARPNAASCTTTAASDDPFSTSQGMSSDSTEMETCIELLKDGVKVL